MVILGRARVSSLEQANNSHALEQQIHRLRDAGATEILSETESGKSKKQLQKLIDRIRQGDVTEIVATRIDRITRSLVQLREFIEICTTLGVNLRILDQQIDLKTPHGRLMLNMLGSLAEWEVDLLQDRVRHGWQHLRRERRAPGIVPFGYKREGDRYFPNLEPYQDTGKSYWEIGREIVETFLMIGTIRGTAREMGLRYGDRRSPNKYSSEEFPREVGLRYWLCNPVLRGHLGYFYRDRVKETILVPDCHEALISGAEFAEIQRLLEFARKSERKTNDIKPLAGLVYCGLCGGKMKAYKKTKNGRTAIRWYCAATHAPVPSCVKSPGIRNEILESATVRALVERAAVLSNTIEGARVAIEDTAEILELLESLRSLEALPLNPIFEEAKTKLKSQIAEARIKLRQEMESQQDLEKELLGAYADIEFWEKWLTSSEKRRAFKRFVQCVVVKAGQVERVELLV
ncbi:MAG TPA: fdxN element excision recombinase XisF [Allocoleopsis sp.]